MTKLYWNFINGLKKIINMSKKYNFVHTHCFYQTKNINGCIIDAYNTKAWFKDGNLHREDGPAVEYSTGSNEWWLNGKRHREDGPAIEAEDGTKMWFKHGKRHREEGPAIEYANGEKHWYKNDKGHRADGPAIEYASGIKHWIFEGVYYGFHKDFDNEKWARFIKTLIFV